jgi:NADPH2:quinone reductase
MKAIRVHHFGGPEALVWEDAPVPAPGPGQVRVRHTAVGLNFIDTYQRSGFYPIALPATLGGEAAGVVEAVGPAVELAVGTRVAYAGDLGADCEARVMPADRLVALPDGIDDRTAAAMMLKGMTAEYLLCRIAKLARGETILVHAAAGGVGLILCQWAHHLGVTVIGTVGSDDKARLAAEHGCTHPVVYTREDFVTRTRELTGGTGVRVVYDSVGKDTFMKSLDCLRPFGLMVSFGQSSGAVPPLDVVTLSQKGSLYLTRPTLNTYTASRADLLASARALFEVVASGAVKIRIGQTYPLAETARAHRDLEARKTTGSSVLVP